MWLLFSSAPHSTHQRLLSQGTSLAQCQAGEAFCPTLYGCSQTTSYMSKSSTQNKTLWKPWSLEGRCTYREGEKKIAGKNAKDFKDKKDMLQSKENYYRLLKKQHNTLKITKAALQNIGRPWKSE
ncbi:hypothetical protein PoB_006825300 [Plakobranchus ocellatus]|uniref:Triple QxxK/R motif-containing protein n=1 Tax=Plakobranchus ocellatus TaxID=259542 RepID=A0AAV4DC09_9GAST|nr:hypothetical protein PoB_006825300 [Plakobranchus ocellatus]